MQINVPLTDVVYLGICIARVFGDDPECHLRKLYLSKWLCTISRRTISDEFGRSGKRSYDEKFAVALHIC